MVMYGRRKILQDDYLLVCQSSDGDLHDRESSVEKEGKTEDQICKRKLKVHRIECYKIADSS